MFTSTPHCLRLPGKTQSQVGHLALFIVSHTFQYFDMRKKRLRIKSRCKYLEPWGPNFTWPHLLLPVSSFDSIKFEFRALESLRGPCVWASIKMYVYRLCSWAADGQSSCCTPNGAITASSRGPLLIVNDTVSLIKVFILIFPHKHPHPETDPNDDACPCVVLDGGVIKTRRIFTTTEPLQQQEITTSQTSRLNGGCYRNGRPNIPDNVLLWLPANKKSPVTPLMSELRR